MIVHMYKNPEIIIFITIELIIGTNVSESFRLSFEFVVEIEFNEIMKIKNMIIFFCTLISKKDFIY
jgi:hypothetical protein